MHIKSVSIYSTYYTLIKINLNTPESPHLIWNHIPDSIYWGSMLNVYEFVWFLNEFVPCTNFCRSCFQHVCSMLREWRPTSDPGNLPSTNFRDHPAHWSWTGTPPIVRNNHICWSWYIMTISCNVFSSGLINWVLGKSWALGLSHPQTHQKRAPNKIMGRGESLWAARCNFQTFFVFQPTKSIHQEGFVFTMAHGPLPIGFQSCHLGAFGVVPHWT